MLGLFWGGLVELEMEKLLMGYCSDKACENAGIATNIPSKLLRIGSRWGCVSCLEGDDHLWFYFCVSSLAAIHWVGIRGIRAWTSVRLFQGSF